MKFGIFDYIDARGETLHKTYEDRLALLQAAEAAGFHGYHLTEHHATPLSMTPSPSVFLAAAARETRRIRLGTLLYLLPLYHPLRLLEELCMLDHLSDGVRCLRRRFRASGRRLRARFEYPLPRLHPRADRLPL